MENSMNGTLARLLGIRPAARAHVAGGAAYPALRGTVDFYPLGGGVLVTASFRGLPYDPAPCAENVLALHIHEGDACTDRPGEPFGGAGPHFNPRRCPHPAHEGDLPPLFSEGGFAWTAFYARRFTVDAVTGRTVVVHARRDDFTTQPAGDAGGRIGCGRIVPLGRQASNGR